MAHDPSIPGGQVDPDQILSHQFSTVRRGYDPLEVQTLLMRIGGELRSAYDRTTDLQAALEDAERRAAAAADLDPTRLTSLLGEETARVIEAARVAATEIRSKAEANIRHLLSEAQHEASELRREAQAVLVTANEQAQTTMDQGRSEAETLIEQGRLDGEAEAEAGRQRGRDMVAEAQQVRERMLRDLARRRKTLRQQIEQLQVGRDRLLAAYDVVRETLSVATDELHVALPEAKRAAQQIGAAAAEGESEAVLDRELEELRVEVGVADDAVEADEVTVVEVIQSDSTESPGDGEISSTTDKPKAPDPVEGRRSSSVRVIRTGEHPIVTPGSQAEPVEEEPVSSSETAENQATEVASIFARIKAQTEQDSNAAASVPGHGTDAEADHAPGSESPLTGDAAVCALRDKAVERLEHNLGRRLKRELSDEQNELLDNLRQVKGIPGAEEVLPTPEGQVERFAGAILPSLTAAVACGADFADTLSHEPRGTDLAVAKVGDLAEDLAAGIVAPLREHLAGCLTEAASDRNELDELVRACFREWRGRKVDGPASRAVLAAFNRGMLDRLPAGTKVRWVVDDPGATSRECDDNARAGSVTKGEPFPSGHLSPPVDAGCRCLVVPDIS